MKHVIFDGMNLVMRAHHVHDVRFGLKTSSGVPTGVLYGVAQSLISWRKRHPKATFWWVEEGAQDGPGTHIERRREIWPAYKEGRGGALGDVLEVQLPLLNGLLQALGIHQCWAKGYEADDVIAWLVSPPEERGDLPELAYRTSGEACVIVSSDRDLLQLVSDHTILSTPHASKLYDRDAVWDEYGVHPEQFLCYRTFAGDSSDGMPGARRVPRKLLASLVNEHGGDLESIYKDFKVSLTAYQRKTLVSFEPQARINAQVMALNPPEFPDVLAGVANESKVAHVCETLELSSLESSLRTFVSSPSGFQKTGDPR